MWIVLFALRYKYTIGVFGVLILLFGLLSGRRMSTDILPRVDSPELSLIWTYAGLNAPEMASKFTSFGETAVMNNVDDLVEVRSETSNGIALIKLRFQPYVNMATAMAQASSISQTILRRMPPGTTPPVIVRTSPSSVPIVQLVLSSETMTGGQLYDYARLTLRAQLQNVPGMRLTLPYGGSARQIMVDLNPDALHAFGLSSAEVTAAVSRQNLTLPAGMLREAGRELPIEINASPENIQGFLDLPIRSVEGRTILLRDVANVRDGEAVSTNVVRLNGQEAVTVSAIKLGRSSTVDIIDGILTRLPSIRAAAPPGLKIEPIFDQSVFVRAAVKAVRHEIILVGGLVALVVLLFLGSWRSTLIVLTSIPLALLCSVAGLYLSGATFNLMTLGGLALAIGILVDNALVEIENTKRQIALGKEVGQAIIDGARQVAFPEFVSTLSICIVFLPVFLLTGTAADVFRPLALAVVFAMVASYLLARTLVPTLASIILPAEQRAEQRRVGPPRGFLRLHLAIEHQLDRFMGVQRRVLESLLFRPWLVLLPVALVMILGAFAAWKSGREFFPRTDAGLIRLFVRAPSGLRIEETGRVTAEVQRIIREVIPARELMFMVENIGPPAAVNQAWIETTSITSSDAEVLVQLSPEHGPTIGYEEKIRAALAARLPTVQAFFRPADATSQTLAGGAATTFEVRFIGRDVPGNLALARELRERFARVPGAVDVILREVLDQPGYAIRVDRTRAATFGINQQDAANAILAALGSGGTVAANVWADNVTGTSYEVQVLAPAASLNSIEDILNLPIRPSSGSNLTLPLRAFADVREKRAPASVSRTALLPTLTVLANTSGRDLGGVDRDLAVILDDLRKRQKPGNRLEQAGQAVLMTSVYAELLGGLGLAALLVFLVMVVNFQSWTLPLAAISGLPVAIAGAVLALLATGTPISVPALMGTIMVVGVSTANSVLVSSFARDRFVAGVSAHDAAIEAATTRLRPVLMTALAMILGVIPMAMGTAEGGEQNAPLGRAVIGGLILGTVASLFLVPVAFAVVCRRIRRVPPASPAIPAPEPEVVSVA